MLKIKQKRVRYAVVCIIAFFCMMFTGCENSRTPATGNDDASKSMHGLSMDSISYRDIPGITEHEIQAIEELQASTDSFVYAMNPGTEAFVEFGEIRGFAALFCEWLTELLGIRFVPALYDWNELLLGLASAEIDFTGELTATDERSHIYDMTGPIAIRSIKYVRMANSVPLQNIVASRTPRYAFIEDTITITYVDSFTQYNFDAVFVDSYEAAYYLLQSAQADAFFDDNSMEAVFDMYDDVISSDFIPVIGMPVSLATQNPSLAPVISVVQKALENGAAAHLAELYEIGRQEHRRHRLYIRLSEEEREFLRRSPVIPFGAEYYNYPISFFNRHDRQWQGIYFDIIDELTELTGMQFELANDQHTHWPDLVRMLEAGDVYFISELLQSEARVGRFLWPSTPIMIDNYTLLSKTDTPNVSINEVLNVRVGIPLATAYAEMFYAWFPLHTNTVEYESESESFLALDRGEVDMVISSQGRLLSLTNYHELSGYKANLIFVHAAESFIGFNAEQTILCSIIDKALHLIDVRGIAAQWSSRTFDYQARILQAQRPWLIGAIILSLAVLSLVSVLFARSRSAGRQLDSLVKKRTAELEVATEAAKAASVSKSAFLANMSHELRTPLNVVIGLTDLTLEDHNLVSGVADNLRKIGNAGSTLLGIVNDILDLSKIESGKLTLIPAEYQIAGLLSDVITIIMVKLGNKPVTFRLNISDDLPGNLYGDDLRIKQILNNLLSNAVKFTQAGTIELTIQCACEDESVWMDIIVSDTGMGISEENLQKLFSDYYQVENEATRKIEGTGLGLSITRQLARMMDGEISAQSEYGKGTTFCVRIRQGYVDNTAIGAELAENLRNFRHAEDKRSARRKLVRADLSFAHVLVVDDMQNNLDVASALLRKYQMQVDCVLSGPEAIERIRFGEPVYNAVFMDHMMPGMDGIESIAAIRGLGTEYAQKIPVIALTANAIEGMEDMFYSHGFQAFLSKPIDIMQMDSVVKKWITK